MAVTLKFYRYKKAKFIYKAYLKNNRLLLKCCTIKNNKSS